MNKGIKQRWITALTSGKYQSPAKLSLGLSFDQIATLIETNKIGS